MKKQNGVTLVELMLALFLSLFTLTLVMTMYLAAEKSFRLQTLLIEQRENSHIALAMLRADIEMTGYTGCAKLLDDELDMKNKIVISEHSITVRHASVAHVNLLNETKNMPLLQVTPEVKFSENDILIISNCNAAEIFQVNHVSFKNKIQEIIPTKALLNQYAKNAEISKLEVNTYFVDKTKRFGMDGKPIYALYRKDINKNTVELVEKISELQAQLDQDHVSHALGVKIALKMQSSLPGQLIETYIALRN